ncbi:MAG: hypothetical protein HOQ24_05405 [Mycobacteriaceae bacterium]|nr:hypothetical protein [Mycobacteriaceae bacterium]
MAQSSLRGVCGRAAAVAVALLGAGVIAGCGGSDSAGGGASSSAAAPSSASANRLNTPEAGRKLCDALRSRRSQWETQSQTRNRIDFNLMAQRWAADIGGLGSGNVDIVRDRSVADTLTAAQCPDVRSDAVHSLGTSDLASALVGR